MLILESACVRTLLAVAWRRPLAVPNVAKQVQVLQTTPADAAAASAAKQGGEAILGAATKIETTVHDHRNPHGNVGLFFWACDAGELRCRRE